MKRISLMFLAAILILSGQAFGAKSGGDREKEGSLKGTLTVSASPELTGLATRWVDDFRAGYPNVKVRVLPATAGSEEPASGSMLNLVETRPGSKTGMGSNWRMVVGRDAVVGMLNPANPVMDNIQSGGLRTERIAGMLTGADATWGSLTGTGNTAGITVYALDNKITLEALSAFTGKGTDGMKVIRVSNPSDLINRVAQDPAGAGFGNLAALTSAGGEGIPSGIALMPIDRNGNGRLDYIEKIYSNLGDLYRGIWIGKYPQALTRSVYVTSLHQPESSEETAFLRYLLTGGQESLAQAGFTRLTNAERLSRIDRLPLTVPGSGEVKGINLIQLLITVLAGLLFILAIVSFIIRNRRLYSPETAEEKARRRESFGEASIEIPKGLLFSKSHTWAFMETNGSVKIGIDDFIQHVTGEITSVRLKKTGDPVIKGEPILTVIQKGKRLELAAPVSGTIRSVNNILFTDPSRINESPYHDGWIYQVEPTGWLRETPLLFMADRYREWIREEFTRLKDFIAGIVQKEDPRFATVILQDGGEIRDSLLENFGPEVWEEFQMNYINKSNI